MENFFNYITRPLPREEVDTWFRANNIIHEKMELFSDFAISLYIMINDTYLGNDEVSKETKIELSESDNEQHFKWCWNKVVSNFDNEGIKFSLNGSHYEYFFNFFTDTYYPKDKNDYRNSIGEFFKELFDYSTPFTKSDLDTVNIIYKLMDSEIIF